MFNANVINPNNGRGGESLGFAGIGAGAGGTTASADGFTERAMMRAEVMGFDSATANRIESAVEVLTVSPAVKAAAKARMARATANRAARNLAAAREREARLRAS